MNGAPIVCAVCDRPVRVAFGGRYAVHARATLSTPDYDADHRAVPTEDSGWLRRAQGRRLPAKVMV